MLTLKSLDTVKVSERIDLPRIEHILTEIPMYQSCDISDIYRYGGEDIIRILDKVQITNRYRYVTVTTSVQLLSPGVTPAPRRNWHFDASTFMEGSVIHLLISDTTSLTEFLAEDIILNDFSENSNLIDVEVYMNQNHHIINPVQVEPNRIYTFDGSKHLHRAIPAKGFELRFMLRILEANDVKPADFKSAIALSSSVYDDNMYDLTKVTTDYIRNNTCQTYESVRKLDDKTILLNYV